MLIFFCDLQLFLCLKYEIILGEKRHSPCNYFFAEYEIMIEEESEGSCGEKTEHDCVKDYEVIDTLYCSVFSIKWKLPFLEQYMLVGKPTNYYMHILDVYML